MLLLRVVVRAAEAASRQGNPAMPVGAEVEEGMGRDPADTILAEVWVQAVGAHLAVAAAAAETTPTAAMPRDHTNDDHDEHHKTTPTRSTPHGGRGRAMTSKPHLCRDMPRKHNSTWTCLPTRYPRAPRTRNAPLCG